MLKNNKGFSFIEVFIATSLIMMVAITFIPISNQLKNERAVLTERQNKISLLQEHLQLLILRDAARIPSESILDNATYTFKEEDEFLKGCVKWINVKHVEEKVCLYGLYEE